MNIYYITNSSFLIKTQNGKRILINPTKFTSNIENIDLIAINNLNYQSTENINNFDNSKILNSVDTFINDFCTITSFNSYQDTLLGYKRGENIIFKITVENLTLCHLGNLGHPLDDSVIKSLECIDILFVPVGENYTIKFADLKNLIIKLSPKYIIPMHYKLSDKNLSMNSLDKFLIFFNSFTVKSLDSLLITDTINSNTSKKIIILNPNEKILE